MLRPGRLTPASLLTTICLLAVAHLCGAAEFTGKVVGVSDGDEVLAQLEAVARVAKAGLWADSNPIPPWDYRLNSSPGASSPEAQSKTFTIGSSKDTVLVVQGTPTAIDKYDALGREVWSYGYSSVTFGPDGKVREWSNESKNLRVDLRPGTSTTPTPTHPGTTARPTASSSGPSRTATESVTVYVTRTGSKYHRAGCRYLKSIIPMSLSDAKRLYSPCSVCRPPG